MPTSSGARIRQNHRHEDLNRPAKKCTSLAKALGFVTPPERPPKATRTSLAREALAHHEGAMFSPELSETLRIREANGVPKGHAVQYWTESLRDGGLDMGKLASACGSARGSGRFGSGVGSDRSSSSSQEHTLFGCTDIAPGECV